MEAPDSSRATQLWDQSFDSCVNPPLKFVSATTSRKSSCHLAVLPFPLLLQQPVQHLLLTRMRMAG